MAVHQTTMIVRFTMKLLRMLNCFIGPDEVEDVPPPSVLLNNPNRVRRQPVHEELLPGLPNSLVLECILPRIPWYVRPLLMATSRAWSNALDCLSASDCHRARAIYDNKDRESGLATSDGNVLCSNLVKVKPFNRWRYAISLYDPEQELWRNLPPIPCGSLPPTPIIAGFMYTEKARNPIRVDYVRGKVIAAFLNDDREDACICDACVWTLDVEGGMWKWEERHSIDNKKGKYMPLMSNMVVVAGKLYILRHGTHDWEKPIVYDVASDEWGQLPDFSKSFYFTTRVVPDPDIENLSKWLFVVCPPYLVKICDPLTGTWKDYYARRGTMN